MKDKVYNFYQNYVQTQTLVYLTQQHHNQIYNPIQPQSAAGKIV